MKIAIGILTCQKYSDRRQACIDTWFTDAKKLGVDPFFCIGRPDLMEREGDVLYAQCSDDYWSLPRKSLAMFQYAVWAGYDYMFKCDDDTYVHVERLLEKLKEGHDYTGYDVGTPQNFRPYASGGAGYVISKKAMDIVVRTPYKPRAQADLFEDLYVGNVLRANQIPFVADDRFSPGKGLFPTKDNTVITGHYITPDHMREIACALSQ